MTHYKSHQVSQVRSAQQFKSVFGSAESRSFTELTSPLPAVVPISRATFKRVTQTSFT